MNRSLDLIWLRIREYFKHPAEDIRQANPIIPGRLYSNFGYICKAVKHTAAEKSYLQDMGTHGAIPSCMLSDKGNTDLKNLRQLHTVVAEKPDLPARCNLCDFYKEGLPCPVYNLLKDGTVVCDTHKYVILKKQR